MGEEWSYNFDSAVHHQMRKVALMSRIFQHFSSGKMWSCRSPTSLALRIHVIESFSVPSNKTIFSGTCVYLSHFYQYQHKDRIIWVMQDRSEEWDPCWSVPFLPTPLCWNFFKSSPALQHWVGEVRCRLRVKSSLLITQPLILLSLSGRVYMWNYLSIDWGGVFPIPTLTAFHRVIL